MNLSLKQKQLLSYFPDYRFGVLNKEFKEYIQTLDLSLVELVELFQEGILYYLKERDIFLITETGWKVKND